VTEILLDIFSNYRISDKIVGVITDNGSNFKKAFKEYGVTVDDILQQTEDSDEEQIDDLNDLSDTLNEILKGSTILPPHKSCASHFLNLIATTDAERVGQC